MEIMFECDQTLPVSPRSKLSARARRSTTSPPPSPSPPPVDETIIGDYAYSTSRLLGKGTYADVYKGRRISDNKVIAVKVISKQKSIGKLNFSKMQLDLFDQFIELNHLHIVNLFGYQDFEDKFYIFMEYCNQKDLDAYITKQTTLSESSIKFFMRQIAEAMKFLTDKGIIHRNLKPSNILLHSDDKKPVSSDMFVKISDFELAHFLEPDTCFPTCVISPYMAPEIILGQPYNAKADLWSIGAIAFHCSNGKPHIDGLNEKQIVAYYKRVNSCVVNRALGVSDGLWRVLFGLLQPIPSKRMNFNDFFNNRFWMNIPSQPGISYDLDSSPEKDDEGEKEAPKSEEATAEEPDVGSPFEEIKLSEQGEIEVTTTRAGETESKKEKPANQDVIEDDFVVITPPSGRTRDGSRIEAFYHPVFEVYLPIVKDESPEPPRRLS